jgi:ribosomal protein S8E
MVKHNTMKKLIYFLCLCSLCLITACKPEIYSFSVSPRTAGSSDTIKVAWRVKGSAFLKIHDISYTPSNSTLASITLLTTGSGIPPVFHLAADSTLIIPVAASGSVSISKKPDGIIDDRLRYITLVAVKKKNQTDSVIQVAVRPDNAPDVIAFRPFVRGDSLIASGTNDSVRWGKRAMIVTVSNSGTRILDISHEGINRTLNPEAVPDPSFKDTLVKGFWSFRTLMTPAEKADTSRKPKIIKLNITIKPN